MGKIDRPVVAHVASRYYALTENWIHTQLKHHTRYRPLVLTWQTENLDGDWSPDCYALLERPKIESLTNHVLLRLLGYYPSFYHVIRRSKARIIHAHFGPQAHFVLPLARATGLPLIATFYGFDVSKLRNNPEWLRRYRDLFQRGDRFLIEGPHMGRQLHDLGCPEQKISIQHLGIDLDKYPYKPRHLADGEPLRILVAGRFTEKKGIVYAIEAVARLASQDIESRLTIIGDAGQGEKDQATKRQIVEAIEKNRLDDWVTLRGMQPYDELRKAYYEHHVFLSPSVHASSGDNEGGAPVTLIEASATGMPIVGTYHCDIPEVVRDRVSGLLAPERDSEMLANHLSSLVKNMQQMEQMGLAGRRHVQAEYDAQKQGERLEAIYNTVSRLSEDE